MDNLVEQVVKKNKNASYYVKVLVCILIDLLVPVTFFVLGFTVQAYCIYIAIFVIPFLIWGSYMFITSLNVDYEYSLLGSTLGIAKIIAKRKRKNLMKIEIKEATDLFKYDEKELNNHKLSKVFFFASDDYSDENYVLCSHSEIRNNFAIIIKPNEELLNAMKPYLNREIRKKVFIDGKENN